MNFKLMLALTAALAAVELRAEDEEPTENAGSSETAEAVSAAEGEESAAPAPLKVQEEVFDLLPSCLRASGVAQVRKPKSSDWEPIERGKYYPLGSSYRTLKGGMLVVAFGRKCTVAAEGEAVFGTRQQPVGGTNRTVVLESGSIRVSTPEKMKGGLFSIAAPGFTVRDPTGDSVYAYRKTGDGDEAVIRCITGQVAIEGRHFSVPQMRVSNQFRIRSSHDNLETIVYGEAGDFTLRLDMGLVDKTKIDENGVVEHHEEAQTFDWALSPETRVQINRAVPAIGRRMSVAVMTFNSKGELVNHWAFCEGRSNINTGDLVKPADEAKKMEAVKQAAKQLVADENKAAAESGESGNTNEGNESDTKSEEEEE